MTTQHEHAFGEWSAQGAAEIEDAVAKLNSITPLKITVETRPTDTAYQVIIRSEYRLSYESVAGVLITALVNHCVTK